MQIFLSISIQPFKHIDDNKPFRTENGSILHQSTGLLLNEQVKGANLLGTSRFLPNEQVKGPNLLETTRFLKNEQVEGANLLESTRFLKNEQVEGPNLLGSSMNRHSVQKKAESCTERGKTGVSYRKGLNPVRKEEKLAFLVQKRTQSCTERGETAVSYRK